MARLDIYDNPIEEDRHAFPYVMDIQSDRSTALPNEFAFRWRCQVPFRA